MAVSSYVFIPPLLGTSNSDINWYNVREWGVEGKGWHDTERYYDRLPSRAHGVVRDPVWNLSRHAAGMIVHFRTNAPDIKVKYQLLLEQLSMSHMPATGVSGLDLYALEGGEWKWINVTRPNNQEDEVNIVKNMAPVKRLFRIYLPLYNGIENLEIGVDSKYSFEPVQPREERPMVFYGTSILHGACASRPGMAFPSILGRRLERPIINLGFSGNGRMELEVGSFITELNACVFVIDCLPNLNSNQVKARAIPLVEQLRKARPDTPILLVEDRVNTNATFLPQRMQHHIENHRALRNSFLKLQNNGVQNLYYLESDQLLGVDGEATTDGSHPSDLGMMRYADAYEPVLRKILNQY